MSANRFVKLYPKHKKRGKSGDVFIIPLPDSNFGIGVLDERKCVAVFDLSYDEIPLNDFTIVSPILFRVITYNRIIGKNGWNIIGQMELTDELAEDACFLHQSIGSNELSIYQSGTYKPVSLENSSGIEKFAVWDENHITQRLYSHLRGLPDPMTLRINRIVRYDPVTQQELPH